MVMNKGIPTPTGQSVCAKCGEFKESCKCGKSWFNRKEKKGVDEVASSFLNEEIRAIEEDLKLQIEYLTSLRKLKRSFGK